MNIMRVLFLGLVFCLTANIYSQQSVNNYKYVIVPERFEFLKENDSYQLNSLTKFLFGKYGFTAFTSGAGLPAELNKNGCLGLRAYVNKNSGMFVTKLKIILKDCNGAVVFTSKEGVSREKDYKNAYHEALRDAFKDIKNLKYTYNKSDDLYFPTKDTPVKSDDASVSIEETSEQAMTSSGNSLSYLFNESNFAFKKQEYGYELFQDKEGTSVSIGKIVKSTKENSYIVKAGDLSGHGYFDGFKNFVLERVNPVTNKVITDTFARQ